MSRRRYVYRETSPGKVEAIEISAERTIEARTEFSLDRHYENLAATDGTDIGSRQKHREYMKRNNLAMADDYRETWKKAQQERAEFFTTGSEKEHREMREDINRAAYHMEQAHRRGRR